jgi:hypothetical protein
MAELDAEIAFFDAHQAEWEAQHMGKWVLVHAGTLVGMFDDFDSAASEAVTKFGRGPYLIRQLGAPPVVLPASVMYVFQSAAN